MAIEPHSSESTIHQIFDQATEQAGRIEHKLRCHDIRRSITPYLETQGNIKVAEKTALELNLGHDAQTTIDRYYNDMCPSDRKTALDALCDRARGITQYPLLLLLNAENCLKRTPIIKERKRSTKVRVQNTKK